MITVLIAETEQTVTGPVHMVARLIPKADTVIGEVTEADRMRAREAGGHPWNVRSAPFRDAA